MLDDGTFITAWNAASNASNCPSCPSYFARMSGGITMGSFFMAGLWVSIRREYPVLFLARMLLPKFNPPTHDLKFLEAAKGTAIWRGTGDGMQTVELRGSALAFEENCERAVSPITLVPNLIAISAWTHETHLEIEGLLELGAITGHSEDFPMAASMRKLRFASDADRIRASMEMMELSHKYMVGLVSTNTVAHGLEMSLASALLNIWTAAEVAATDLWMTAVNLRPDPLALNALNPQGNQRKDDVEDDLALGGEASKMAEAVKTFIRKSVEMAHMPNAGQQIKDAGHFNFNRLGGIRQAYLTTFKSDATTLFSEQNLLSLIALECVRNALVHNAGKVDDGFRKRLKKHPEAYERMGLSKVGADGKILIDGDAVKAAFEDAIVFCKKLFSMVDAWFVANPA